MSRNGETISLENSSEKCYISPMRKTSPERARKARERAAAYRLANPELVAARNKEYRVREASSIREKRREYRQRNADSLRKKKAADYIANRDAERAKRKARRNPVAELARATAWGKANPDRKRRLNREWQKRHPDKVLAKTQRRLAVVARAPGGGVTAHQWSDVVAQSLGLCTYCCDSPLRLTMDHVEPISTGGHHDIENVVAACNRCNASKRDRKLLVWLALRAGERVA